MKIGASKIARYIIDSRVSAKKYFDSKLSYCLVICQKKSLNKHNIAQQYIIRNFEIYILVHRQIFKSRVILFWDHMHKKDFL